MEFEQLTKRELGKLKKALNNRQMRLMDKFKYLLSITILVIQVSCAQDLNNKKFSPLVANTYTLNKVQCDCDTPGYKIKIKVPHAFDDMQSCHYSNSAIIRAEDSLKISVLRDLLKIAETDSSLCCMRVKKYGFDKSPNPQSTNYNLQIDALYLFNFIAFGVETRKFSPYPVLYNIETRKEINNSPDEIKEVFNIYRKWFFSTEKTKFKNYQFPMVGSKYKWLRSTDIIILFSELPSHPQVDNLGYPL